MLGNQKKQFDRYLRKPFDWQEITGVGIDVLFYSLTKSMPWDNREVLEAIIMGDLEEELMMPHLSGDLDRVMGMGPVIIPLDAFWQSS